MFGIEEIVGIEELQEVSSRGKHASVLRSAHTSIGLLDQLDPIAERCEARRIMVCRAVVNDHDLGPRVGLV